MKIVAFLQNLWVRDPIKVKAMFERYPAKREWMLRFMLFRGGRTGKLLRQHLGDDLVERIVWEESTKQIAGTSSDAFPPDIEHIAEVIARHQPEHVVGFGKVACCGIQSALTQLPGVKLETHFLPHPCARPAQDPIGAMRDLREKLP